MPELGSIEAWQCFASVFTMRSGGALTAIRKRTDSGNQSTSTNESSRGSAPPTYMTARRPCAGIRVAELIPPRIAPTSIPVMTRLATSDSSLRGANSVASASASGTAPPMPMLLANHSGRAGPPWSRHWRAAPRRQSTVPNRSPSIGDRVGPQPPHDESPDHPTKQPGETRSHYVATALYPLANFISQCASLRRRNSTFDLCAYGLAPGFRLVSAPMWGRNLARSADGRRAR